MTRPEPCSWRFAHYQACLEYALELGYTFSTFSEYEPGRDHLTVILRHDVDCSLERALHMARIEHRLGIRATYFVRVHAPTYNPFSFTAYTVWRELAGQGHELGLHYEVADMHALTGEHPVRLFLRAKGLLELVLDRPVVSAAQHGDFTRVTPDPLDHFFTRVPPELVGIANHTFEDRFFREMKYISDSGGHWREGCMCGHLGRHKRLQILCHPCWWFERHYHLIP